MQRFWRGAGAWFMAGMALVALAGCIPVPFTRTICSMPAEFLTFSTPTYANGVVYLGGRFGHLYALNPANGQLLWEYTTTPDTPEALSQPVVDGTTVYVRDQNHVYAFDAQQGALRWVTPDLTGSAGFIPDAVVATPDAVIIATLQGITALDAATGKVRWTLARTLSTTPMPVSANGIVYAAGDGIYALRASDGHVLWHVAAVNSVQATGMALAGANLILIGNAPPSSGQTTNDLPAEYLWSVDAQTGAPHWRTAIASPTRLGSVIALNGMAYAVISANDGTTQGGTLHAFDAATGQETWSYASSALGLLGDHEEVPIIAGGVAYLGGRQAIALDLTSRQPLWQAQPSRLPVAIGAANDAFVYAADAAYGGFGCGKPPQLVEGTVFALDAATGQTSWQVALSHGQAHP